MRDVFLPPNGQHRSYRSASGRLDQTNNVMSGTVSPPAIARLPVKANSAISKSIPPARAISLIPMIVGRIDVEQESSRRQQDRQQCDPNHQAVWLPNPDRQSMPIPSTPHNERGPATQWETGPQINRETRLDQLPGVMMWAAPVPAPIMNAPPSRPWSGRPVDALVAPGTAMVMCLPALA